MILNVCWASNRSSFAASAWALRTLQAEMNSLQHLSVDVTNVIFYIFGKLHASLVHSYLNDCYYAFHRAIKSTDTPTVVLGSAVLLAWLFRRINRGHPASRWPFHHHVLTSGGAAQQPVLLLDGTAAARRVLLLLGHGTAQAGWASLQPFPCSGGAEIRNRIVNCMMFSV